MRILWLADVLRDAGLTVVEHAGWTTHYRPGTWEPRYGVVHATAAARTSSDETQVAIVRNGRSDLQGPIANACLDRQGRWHVLGAGRCNTTLAGTAGPYEGLGNTYALGVEACNDNRGEPWPAVQYRAYVRGWAAICRRLGWEPARLRGHKEHTPGRKTDPTFDMAQFRADVARVLAGEDDDMTQDELLGTTLSNGFTINNALVTLLARTPTNVAARLDAILAAAVDDGNTTVTMSPEDRAALAAQLAQAVEVPTAGEVADEFADRLGS